MGQHRVDQVIENLKAAGIRAAYAYPGEKIPALTHAAAAVYLKEADLWEGTVTVQTVILSPAADGAENCERVALEAAEVLRGIGYACKVGSCSFDKMTGHFCTNMTAVFADAIPQKTLAVKLGVRELHYAVAFSAQKQTDKENPNLEEAAWNFRLEEFFPLGEAEYVTAGEPFSLICGNEAYYPCAWTMEKRQWEENGLRVIREGTAEGLVYLDA